MDKATQRSKILAYCAEHGSITVREAFTQLGINSPTKHIREIRNSRGTGSRPRRSSAPNRTEPQNGGSGTT